MFNFANKYIEYDNHANQYYMSLLNETNFDKEFHRNHILSIYPDSSSLMPLWPWDWQKGSNKLRKNENNPN